MNSGTKKLWWQKLVSRKPKNTSIQRWKNLSPDEPPLPFIVVQPSIKSSELLHTTSEVAPTKNEEFIPSASLYIPHNHRRELYIIPELSETNTTDSIVTTHNSSSHDNNNNNDNDRLTVPPVPLPPVPPIVQPIFSDDDDDDDDDNNENEEEEQQQQEETTMTTTTEHDAKILFRRILENRMKDIQNVPKKLRLKFNSQDNLESIQYISTKERRQTIPFSGTPQSIPPELLICDTYNHESTSVWILGILLFHMLVGKYPFDQDVTHMELFNQMLDPNFITLPLSLSWEAQDLLKHLLMPDPQKRATFAFILSHPWLVQSQPTNTTTTPTTTTTKKSKSKKAFSFIKKVTRLVFKGPNPPPPTYRKKKYP
ncbi:kinase-like domain-containing protein [Pilaira anomala]|nr:kinase-like domain-containing protein [Pilaira anomala]